MTARDRRALGLGAVLVLTAWGGIKGIPGLVLAVRHTEESISQRAELAARASRKLSNLSSLGDSLRVLERAVVSVPSFLLVGEDAETAAVDLMRRVRTEIPTPEAALTSFGAHSMGERSGDLTLAMLSVTVESDFRGLVELVGHLEADSALAVESIDISAGPTPDSIRDRELLSATMTVSGWYRASESSGDQFLPIPLTR